MKSRFLTSTVVLFLVVSITAAPFQIAFAQGNTALNKDIYELPTLYDYFLQIKPILKKPAAQIGMVFRGIARDFSSQAIAPIAKLPEQAVVNISLPFRRTVNVAAASVGTLAGQYDYAAVSSSDFVKNAWSKLIDKTSDLIYPLFAPEGNGEIIYITQTSDFVDQNGSIQNTNNVNLDNIANDSSVNNAKNDTSITQQVIVASANTSLLLKTIAALTLRIDQLERRPSSVVNNYVSQQTDSIGDSISRLITANNTNVINNITTAGSAYDESSVDITGGSITGVNATTTDLNVTGSLGFDGLFGSSGQVLTSQGTSTTPIWQTLSSSQWTTSGSDIYFTTGNVGIGTTTPNAKLQVLGSSNQLQIGYDASNYWTATTSSTGVTTFNAFGSGARFDFADNVKLNNASDNAILFSTDGYIDDEAGDFFYERENYRIGVGTAGSVAYFGNSLGMGANYSSIDLQGGSSSGLGTIFADSSAASPELYINNVHASGTFDFYADDGSVQLAKIGPSNFKLYSSIAGTDYLSVTTGSNGAITFDAVGSNSLFTFSDKVGIGTTTPEVRLDLGIDYLTTNSTFRTGTFELQPYALNNSFLMENAYYNGSNWTRRNTGTVEGFQFYNGQTLFLNVISGSGNFTATYPFKTDSSNSGTVAFGGNISTTIGDYAGAQMVVLGSGNVGIGTISPLQKLSVVSGNGTGLLMTYDSSNNYRSYLNTYFNGGSAATTNISLTPSDGSTTGYVNALSAHGNQGVSIGTYAVSSAPPTGGLIVSGSVGIGTTTPGAIIHALGTTEQLRLGYDASKYSSFTASSSGALTITSGGTSQNINLTPSGSGSVVLAGVTAKTASGRLIVNSGFTTGNDFEVFDSGQVPAQGSYTTSYRMALFGGNASGVIIPSNWSYKFSSLSSGVSTDHYNTQDTALGKKSAGILEVTNGTTGTWRDLIVRNLSMGTTSTSTTLTLVGDAGKNPFSIASSTGARLLTVNQSGSLGVGVDSPLTKFQVADSNTGGAVAYLVNTGTGSGDEVLHLGVGATSAGTSNLYVAFYQGSTAASRGTRIGYIQGSGSDSVTYNTTSDRRVKDNISASTKGLDDLMKIGVKDFNFKNNNLAPKVQGFIAQDLYEVYPYAVAKTDNGVDLLSEDAVPWGVDYGRITPLIVKSVQDLNLKLDTLADVDAPWKDSENEDTFAGRFFERVKTWLASASNGIKNIFAEQVDTKKLCVTDDNGEKTCITKNQLDLLLINAGQMPASVSAGQGLGVSIVAGGDNTQGTTTLVATTTITGVGLVGDSSQGATSTVPIIQIQTVEIENNTVGSVELPPALVVVPIIEPAPVVTVSVSDIAPASEAAPVPDSAPASDTSPVQ